MFRVFSLLATCTNGAFLGVGKSDQHHQHHQLVPCSFARELFDQGLSALSAKPVCASENDDLYLAKQCTQKSCYCVNPDTGAPDMPRREIAAAFQHILVCSKSACIDESKATHAKSVDYHQMGFADLPMVILCDPKGNYRRLQNDPTTSRKWCFGPNGTMREDITGMFEPSTELKSCFVLYQKWLATSTTTTTTTTSTTTSTSTTTTSTTTTTTTTEPFIAEEVEIISLDFSDDSLSRSNTPPPMLPQYLPCFKAARMFQLGFIGGIHEARECDFFNSNLYKEKQCMETIGSCECVDAKSGEKSELKRTFDIEFKDKIVCSGTPCLRQATESLRLAKLIEKRNMVDLPFLPSCDGAGFYTPFQSDPTTGKSWCYGPNGEFKMEITDRNVSGNQLKYCFEEYNQFMQQQQQQRKPNKKNKN